MSQSGAHSSAVPTGYDDVRGASAEVDDPEVVDPGDAQPEDAADPVSDAPVGFAVFETAIGPCGIAWGPGGITGVQLPEDSADEVREVLAVAQPGAVEARPPDAVRAAVERIRALLAGDSRDDLVDVELDMSGLTPFLRRTYAITRTIAPGHTLTYGQIAERLGSPGLARAVGRAMGANPFPIIVPCHRVLGADGSIGGFSAHGGALTKRRMLLAEGVPESEEPALFGTDELYPGGADSV